MMTSACCSIAPDSRRAARRGIGGTPRPPRRGAWGGATGGGGGSSLGGRRGRRGWRVPVPHLPVQLRERDDGEVQLLRERLQRARDLGDLLLAAVLALRAAHELNVVDDDQAELRRRVALQTTRLGAQLQHRQRG